MIHPTQKLDILMQIQSDIAGLKIVRPKIIETTAQGVAFLAGLNVGYWKSIEETQYNNYDLIN